MTNNLKTNEGKVAKKANHHKVPQWLLKRFISKTKFNGQALVHYLRHPISRHYNEKAKVISGKSVKYIFFEENLNYFKIEDENRSIEHELSILQNVGENLKNFEENNVSYEDKIKIVDLFYTILIQKHIFLSKFHIVENRLIRYQDSEKLSAVNGNIQSLIISLFKYYDEPHSKLKDCPIEYRFQEFYIPLLNNYDWEILSTENILEKPTPNKLYAKEFIISDVPVINLTDTISNIIRSRINLNPLLHFHRKYNLHMGYINSINYLQYVNDIQQIIMPFSPTKAISLTKKNSINNTDDSSDKLSTRFLTNEELRIINLFSLENCLEGIISKNKIEIETVFYDLAYVEKTHTETQELWNKT